ncbi:sporulation protein [Bacteroidia bacterium]|nr:sporulation protein [Bacteroidia bacterium]
MQAQKSERPQILSDIEKNSTIEVIQPTQLEQLLSMQIANNYVQKGIQGYRIRIFSQSGQAARQKSTNMKAAFSESFSEINAYLTYNEPNYQIFVGDFRTKTEALYYLKLIGKKYPSAFIVKSLINI